MVIVLILSIFHTGVECCLFVQGLPEPPVDKRNCSTLFLYNTYYYFVEHRDTFSSQMDIKNEPLILHYLYNDVLLYYERVVKKHPTGYRISNSFIRAYLLGNSIYPTIEACGSTIKIPEEFEKTAKPFIICLKNSEYSMLVSVLWHIRNSLAHGRFALWDIDGSLYISLRDISGRKKSELTMIAQMPFASFYGLIEQIKKYRG